MGVDYISCIDCHKAFPDTDYDRCEECGRVFCGKCWGYDKYKRGCLYCYEHKFTDDVIISFMCKKYGKSVGEIIEEMRCTYGNGDSLDEEEEEDDEEEDEKDEKESHLCH